MLTTKQSIAFLKIMLLKKQKNYSRLDKYQTLLISIWRILQLNVLSATDILKNPGNVWSVRRYLVRIAEEFIVTNNWNTEVWAFLSSYMTLLMNSTTITSAQAQDLFSLTSLNKDGEEKSNWVGGNQIFNQSKNSWILFFTLKSLKVKET